MAFEMTTKSAEFHGATNVFNCLIGWTGKAHTLRCEKDEDTLVLNLPGNAAQDRSPLEVRVKDVYAKHSYNYIMELTMCGMPELSKHYELMIVGVDDSGSEVQFKLYLHRDSEDAGETWSPLNFTWNKV